MTTEQSIPNITPEEETWGNELQEMIKYLEDYQECPSSMTGGSNEISRMRWEIKKMNYSIIEKEEIVKKTLVKVQLADKLTLWKTRQLKKYSKKREHMSIPSIRLKWETFLSNPRYTDYFLSEEDFWYSMFRKVKAYMDEHGKRPTVCQLSEETAKLSKWMNKQNLHYPKNRCMFTNLEIKKTWSDLRTNPLYSDHFITREEWFYIQLEKVKAYMDENSKAPDENSEDLEVKKLGEWFHYRKIDYLDWDEIMRYNSISSAWKAAFVDDVRYACYYGEKAVSRYRMIEPERVVHEIL
jgi:hypothetical protein